VEAEIGRLLIVCDAIEPAGRHLVNLVFAATAAVLPPPGGAGSSPPPRGSTGARPCHRRGRWVSRDELLGLELHPPIAGAVAAAWAGGFAGESRSSATSGRRIRAASPAVRAARQVANETRDDQLGDRLPTMRSTTIDVHGPVHLAEWGEGRSGRSCARPGRLSPQLDAGGAGAGAVWTGAGARSGRIRPQPGRRPPASVPAQRALLHRLIRQTCDQPVLLAGNSMGGMIALGEAALHPECVAGLMLVDAVLPGHGASGARERL